MIIEWVCKYRKKERKKILLLLYIYIYLFNIYISFFIRQVSFKSIFNRFTTIFINSLIIVVIAIISVSIVNAFTSC